MPSIGLVREWCRMMELFYRFSYSMASIISVTSRLVPSCFFQSFVVFLTIFSSWRYIALQDFFLLCRSLLFRFGRLTHPFLTVTFNPTHTHPYLYKYNPLQRRFLLCLLFFIFSFFFYLYPFEQCGYRSTPKLSSSTNQ